MPCGTCKSESESDDANDAETPVATQQTGAILLHELGEHVPNEVRVLKTAGKNAGTRAMFDKNLNCRGQGLSSTMSI